MLVFETNRSGCVPLFFSFILLNAYVLASNIQAQSYEDARCKCVCTIINGTQIYKELYITSVPTNNDCDSVVPSPIAQQVNNQTEELCPRCQCNYESRNTTIIKVVVIIVVWVISLLLIYMLFLICLDPMMNKHFKRSVNQYTEHTNEEDSVSVNQGRMLSDLPVDMNVTGAETSSSSPAPTVLNRVTSQQDKWKRQVREQRRNIYDRHAILN